jgi:hypothetical protein
LVVPQNFHDNPLIRKIESVFMPSDDERQALETLPMQVVAIKPDQDIVREGGRPSRSCLILRGFACTYKVTKDGKRQIIAFNLAGDVPDLESLHLKVLERRIVKRTRHKQLRDSSKSAEMQNSSDLTSRPML